MAEYRRGPEYRPEGLLSESSTPSLLSPLVRSAALRTPLSSLPRDKVAAGVPAAAVIPRGERREEPFTQPLRPPLGRSTGRRNFRTAEGGAPAGAAYA